MGLLSVAELKDPDKWIGKSAEDILRSVRQEKGWQTIFPKKVPTWLHKIRNYFNVEPVTLRLVDHGTTAHWMADIRKYGQLNAFIKGPKTLSGHVYFDEEVEVWYQMGAGGTIYHWGRDVISWLDWADAAVAHAVRTQAGIPIFKLICPDGTGGSKETIIKNPKLDKVAISTSQGDYFEMQRRSKIADTNEVTMVKPRIITNAHHQGSYNFSETAVNGLDSHEDYDVHPHHDDPVYVDPPNRFAPLKDRVFKEWVLAKAGARTKMASDFDEPPVVRSPHGVSRSGV